MKTASVTVDGDHQSVHLPPDIRLDGDQVFVRMVGSAVMLVPKRFSQPFEPVSDDFIRRPFREELVGVAHARP